MLHLTLQRVGLLTMIAPPAVRLVEKLSKHPRSSDMCCMACMAAQLAKRQCISGTMPGCGTLIDRKNASTIIIKS
jgi:hypothetical protein